MVKIGRTITSYALACIAFMLLTSCSSKVDYHPEKFRTDLQNVYDDKDFTNNTKVVDTVTRNKSLKLAPPIPSDSWTTSFGGVFNRGGNFKVNSTSFKGRMFISSDITQDTFLYSYRNHLAFVSNKEFFALQSHQGSLSVESQVYLPYIGCKRAYSASYINTRVAVLCASNLGEEASIYVLDYANPGGYYKKGVGDIILPSSPMPSGLGMYYFARDGLNYADFNSKDSVIEVASVIKVPEGFYSHIEGGSDIAGWSPSSDNQGNLLFSYGSGNSVLLMFDLKAHAIQTLSKTSPSYIEMPRTVAVAAPHAYYFDSRGLVEYDTMSREGRYLMQGVFSSMPPIITQNAIFIFNEITGRVQAISRAGKMIWNSNRVIKHKAPHMIIANNTLIIPDNGSLDMISIDARNGRTLKTESMMAEMRGNFVIHNSIICYFDKGGHLNYTM